MKSQTSHFKNLQQKYQLIDTNCFCVVLRCFEASSLNEDVTWRGVRDYLVLAGGYVVCVRDVSCLGGRSCDMSEGRTLFWREV